MICSPKKFEIMDQLLDDELEVKELVYAPFWKRVVAVLIDGLLIGVPLNLITLSVANSETGSMIFSLIGILVYWFYFAGLESSEKQATIGKQAMGLKVTDMEGHPISFGKATGRHFGKILSSLILGIGYIMAAFTDKKQALHDIMAKALVVEK
jgi:uncharacterized RDD family membrane protein YckC